MPARYKSVIDRQNAFLNRKYFLSVEKIEILQNAALNRIFNRQNRKIDLARYKRGDNGGKTAKEQYLAIIAKLHCGKLRITTLRSQTADFLQCILHAERASLLYLCFVCNIENQPLRIRPTEARIGDRLTEYLVVFLTTLFKETFDHESFDNALEIRAVLSVL